MRFCRIPSVAGLLIALIAAPSASALRAAEEFILEVPDAPQEGSKALLDEGRLVVVDAAGKRFEYARRAELDIKTPAGRFAGYYCPKADQYLLWPTANAGSMLIGAPEGGKIHWRRSQMRVRAAPAPRQPGTPMNAPAALEHQPAGPVHVAVSRAADGSPLIAHIDARGKVHVYRRSRAGWQHRVVKTAARLVPGAPLVLRPAPGAGDPLVDSFDSRGVLTGAVPHERPGERAVAEHPRFHPGSHLALVGPPEKATAVAAVDERGRLWLLDLVRREPAPIDAQQGRFPAGCPVAAVSLAEDHVMAIDARGRLMHYHNAAGHWSQPEVLGDRFVPGGGVAAFAIQSPGAPWQLKAAGIDARGVPRILQRTPARWTDEAIDVVFLPPGGPVELSAVDGRLTLTAVGGEGEWIELARRDDRWARRTVAVGFPIGGHVIAAPEEPLLASVDATGRLVAVSWREDAWHPTVLVPPRGFVPVFPQLAERTIQPRPAIPAAAVTLHNRHTEELLVRIADARQLGRPSEVTIPPGGAVQRSFDRDSGAEIVEVYLIPGPAGGMIRDERRYPIPPRVIYSVAVYANRVTSRYVDRRPDKPKHALPDFETKTPVSLGAFAIPPGESLQPGSRLDVYREAGAQGNPGAAAWFGPAGPR